MAITSVYPHVTPYVGNPAVEMVRRENKLREIIEPVAQMERNASEKGVISEDKSRNNSNLANVTYSDELKNRNTELKQAVEGRSQDQQQGRDDGSRSDDNPNQSDQQKQQQQQQAEQKQLAQLKARDAEVRAHEAAHAAVGGQLAGSPSYTFQRGPDGQQYAIGGEVQISLSEVPGDPQATIARMQQVKAAALAPAEPSGADRSIAAEANRRISAAQAELLKENSLLATEADGKEVEVTDEALAAEETSARDRFAGRDKRALQGEELMQLRSDVIQSFYARATVPAGRSLLNMA
ncbi:MAG: putative metalloprotease CJM1_0395 family protein [Rheinheimera sp.]|nr:putative metalloprotease CJM1_0395 family protein [Rheinheimera sp.]